LLDTSVCSEVRPDAETWPLCPYVVFVPILDVEVKSLAPIVSSVCIARIGRVGDVDVGIQDRHPILSIGVQASQELAALVYCVIGVVCEVAVEVEVVQIPVVKD
jgi:hypothetical protein